MIDSASFLDILSSYEGTKHTTTLSVLEL